MSTVIIQMHDPIRSRGLVVYEDSPPVQRWAAWAMLHEWRTGKQMQDNVPEIVQAGYEEMVHHGHKVDPPVGVLPRQALRSVKPKKKGR